MNLNASFNRVGSNAAIIESKSETVNSANSSLNGYWANGTWYPSTVGDTVPMTTTYGDPNYGGLTGGFGTNSIQTFGPFVPTKTAAGDFFKVQYAEVEVRCAITRKMVPAGSPVMLLGGMVISQQAFESWLEEHLAGMISRHQDLHTDNAGYDE